MFLVSYIQYILYFYPLGPIFYGQRSVDMDTKKMDTGVHVHVTDMDVDMDT